LALGGGERLPAAEMFARVRASLPFATVPLPLGRPLLRLLAALLPGARGPVSRLDRDLVADNAEASALLGVAPRPFRVDAAMWRMDAGGRAVRVAVVPGSHTGEGLLGPPPERPPPPRRLPDAIVAQDDASPGGPRPRP